MRLIRQFTLGAAMLLVASTTRAQSPATSAGADSVKMRLVHELMTASHVVDNMMNVMHDGLPMQRAANPQVPAEFWDRFMAAVTARRPELDSAMAVIYAKYFTDDDLRQLLTFYQTPVGRKLLDVQPAVTRDAMQVGQQWGKRLGLEVATQMMKEQAAKTP